ncbi:hypothetical protein ACJRO7_016539 [Eucalyptus globulus]|uniref:NB-ARC domain-containing protein n=1 Tax=Eucalyptus globulus TaxID=34317 RepID=A0ABD3LB09_EUCGL
MEKVPKVRLVRCPGCRQLLPESTDCPVYRTSHIVREVTGIVVKLKEFQKKDEAKEGIDKQVEDMMDLLDLEVSDVRIVGIWGKGGVGKTTLAKVIYEQISSQFDSCSFLADIETTVKQLGGFQLLQSKLMSDILNREYEVDLVAKGVDFFKGILRNMKVLIVLDAVEVQSHLHKIVGEKLDWFGDGSRIIVTTSVKSVLPDFISQGLAHVYGINVMNNDQALELFRKHVLRKNLPISDFDEIAICIIDSVNGIPLHIEVIGSLLSRKVVEVWIALKKLILQSGLYIEMILMASFRELSQEQREMFLDIACLPADVDSQIASFMWHNPNNPPSDGVDALCAMSLVKIGNDNQLVMHRLLREFGQLIIQKEDDLYPGTRGRLCNLELARKTKKMELVKLRILSLKDCRWIGRLPASICNLGNSLEELDITGTGISELSNSITCLGHLKVLKMDSCFIRELPREIGNLVNLEELHASHCRSLKGAIPTAIKSLDRLKILRLGHSSISAIPLEIGSLSCLQTLDLLRCNEIQVLPELPSSLTCLRVSSKRMEALPDLKDLVKLEEIRLGDKDPKELICPSTRMEPKSRSSDLLVAHIVLPKLKMLELSHPRVSELQLGDGSLSCSHLKKLVLSGVNLERVLDLPSSLSVLSIRRCSSLRQLPAVHHLSKLSELHLIQSAVEEIKGLQGLIALEILNISHCEICNLDGLGQLTDLRSLILSDCNSLGALPDISNLKMLKVLVVRRCRMIPDNKFLM